MKKGVSAIILAAGSGSRMNSSIKKQFIKLASLPVLYYSLKAFEDSEVDEIILVLSREDIPYCKNEIVERYGIKKVKAYVEGGKERYESVANGLMAVQHEYCMIHDGARPLITTEQINDMIPEGMRTKACIQAVPVKDTIKVVEENKITESPTRSKLYSAQTPQMFLTDLVKSAYQKMKQEKGAKTNITDDAMVVQLFENKTVEVVKGSYENIKVTTPEDIVHAEAILNGLKKTVKKEN